MKKEPRNLYLGGPDLSWFRKPRIDFPRTSVIVIEVLGATMTQSSRHDAWQAGDSYDLYMGRWSRQIAPRFVDWLAPQHQLDWLEIGCGTGALTANILSDANPRSLRSIDPSEGFLNKARLNVTDPRVEFLVGDAQSLTADSDSKDVVVSGLVLNFVPDREAALREMARTARPGGIIAFYVWDYPGGGVEFMRAFWNAATSLDEKARDLTEDRRFPFCTCDGLVDLAARSGLSRVEATQIEAPTLFRDFDDLWHPFTLGAGPAPGYCASLGDTEREKLRTRLQASLPCRDDGSILLKTRAWAIRATKE
jgi:SAM-dependent methyltransferase